MIVDGVVEFFGMILGELLPWLIVTPFRIVNRGLRASRRLATRKAPLGRPRGHRGRAG